MKAANSLLEVKIKDNRNDGFQVAESQISIGVVLSVGDDVKYIKKGYEVLFDRYKAMSYSVNGTDSWFVKEETILAYEK